MIYGFASATAGLWLIFYAAAIIICFQKGKKGFGWMGIFGFLVPVLWVLVVVGAIRLAFPDSRWARERYGPEKMARAEERWPDQFVPQDLRESKAEGQQVD